MRADDEQRMDFESPSLAGLIEMRQNHQTLYRSRGVSINYQSHLLDVLQHAVQTCPEQLALSVFKHSLTYRELWDSVQRLAAWMRQDAELKSGDRVAIYLPNSLSYVVAVYAAWLANLIVVNMGLINDDEQLIYQLQDSGSKLLVTLPSVVERTQPMLLQTSIRHVVTTTQEDYAGLVRRLSGVLSPRRLRNVFRSQPRIVAQTRLRQILSHAMPVLEWPALKISDPALIQYTSGTGARPKGATLTHANLIANIQQMQHVLGQSLLFGRTGLCPILMQHILGLGSVLMLLATQGHAVLTSSQDLLERPKILQRHRLDLIFAVPFIYEQLLRSEFDLKALAVTAYLSGGSPVSRHLQAQWHARTGLYICEGYGMSETSPLIALSPPDRVRLGSAGVILPETEVRIASLQHGGQAAGFNEAGELWVRGPQVMRGYWQHPGATLQMITPDGWLKTGDIVSLSEDGYLTVLERQKDVFWVQNQIVFPQEVEQAATSHEDVIDCVAIQDQQDLAKPVQLFVVAKAGLTCEKLQQHLEHQLKKIQRPDKIVFVDHLPRGVMGKLMRRLLRERFRDDASNPPALAATASAEIRGDLSDDTSADPIERPER